MSTRTRSGYFKFDSKLKICSQVECGRGQRMNKGLGLAVEEVLSMFRGFVGTRRDTVTVANTVKLQIKAFRIRITFRGRQTPKSFCLTIVARLWRVQAFEVLTVLTLYALASSWAIVTEILSR